MPIPGSKYCSQHGGLQSVLPPGDPRRGGRPITHGLYSKYLSKKILVDYNEAEVGTLDYDIKVAKAKLAWALRKWQEDPDGGPVTSSSETEKGSSTTRKLWSDIVESHHKTVKELEKTHHEITAAVPVSPVTAQVNIFVGFLGQMPDEALRRYAEKGVLEADAWLETGEAKKKP